jgi:hypothetical protein
VGRVGPRSRIYDAGRRGVSSRAADTGGPMAVDSGFKQMARIPRAPSFPCGGFRRHAGRGSEPAFGPPARARTARGGANRSQAECQEAPLERNRSLLALEARGGEYRSLNNPGATFSDGLVLTMASCRPREGERVSTTLETRGPVGLTRISTDRIGSSDHRIPHARIERRIPLI